MSFVARLKNKVRELDESVPAYTVTKKVSLPIYSYDTTQLLDPNIVKDICLSVKAELNDKNSDTPDFLYGGWQSPYYHYKNDPKYFELFSPVIDMIETRVNVKRKQKLIISRFWIVIYQKGAAHGWHDHADDQGTFKHVGVYYPASSENASPLEFENLDGENLLVNVKAGQLLTFPAVLMHRVPACPTDDLRIVVAFNLEELE